MTGRVLFTGSPGSGKTSVLEQFALKGVNVIPEVARPLMDIMHAHEPEKFQRKGYLQDVIETLQLRDFVANTDAIFDRGLPDQVAYRMFFDVPILPSFATRCHTYKYDKVFLFPYWEEIYVNDKVRAETKEEAQRLDSLTRMAYKLAGYDIIEVPKMSVNLRVKFIEKQLSL